MTPKEVLRLKPEFHFWKAMRRDIVLMDRTLAAKLQSAIFSYELFPTKTDYDHSKDTRYPVLWAEDFVVRLVWNEHYSSSVLGIPRPPLAAVISDMLAMISFFESQQNRRNSVVAWMHKFLYSTTLYSIPEIDFDDDWPSRGYLADMFSILACCPSLLDGKAPPSGYGLNNYRSNTETLVALDDQTTPAQLLFFKTDPPPVSTVASDPSISLDDLDAVFIHSGPFQFRNTDRVDEHLSLDGQNHILIYFDIWKGDQGIPGQLGPYGLQTIPPRPGQESVGSTTLAVTNLPYRVRSQDLKDLFRRYGTPSRADVFLAPDGRSRTVGKVSMRTRREAENCVNDLNGYEWFGRRIKVKIDETSGYYQTKHHPTQKLSFYDKHFLKRFPPLHH